jgi:hypothetical protein
MPSAVADPFNAAAKRVRPARSSDQPELPLKAVPKDRPAVLAPEIAARIAVSRRAKPSPVPDHVRLVLTLELRRELAEKLSLKAIKSERNIEAIVIALIDAAAKRWRLPTRSFAPRSAI